MKLFYLIVRFDFNFYIINVYNNKKKKNTFMSTFD